VTSSWFFLTTHNNITWDSIKFGEFN